MNAKELRELDDWIANLNEKKPGPKPLVEVRRGRDGDYNSAHQVSHGGWWICETGTDAEHSHLGDQTPCLWRPNYKVASDPCSVESGFAAMQVLEKCAEKISGRSGAYKIHVYKTSTLNDWCVAQMGNDSIYGQAETLPLAVAKFAKKLFSK